MSIQYFAQTATVEEIKSLYRNLAMQHHPDRGGSEEVMKEINRQYHEALKRCDGQQGDPERKPYEYKPDVETEIMEKLLELLKLRSLDIALIGCWLWVSGNTKSNRDALKAAGLQWHSERKCWYYKPQGWKRSYKSKGSLAQLADRYGYRKFQTAKDEQMPVTR